MPIYDADSEFASKRDEAKARIEAKRQEDLRKAVDSQPDRFVSPERFRQMAAELDENGE